MNQRIWPFFGAKLKKKIGVVKVILRINLIKSTLGVVHEEKLLRLHRILLCSNYKKSKF